ncbi:MAG: PSD1 and planctomycete cytochrome C domain-containing protein [Planctomycetota bacterium]
MRMKWLLAVLGSTCAWAITPCSQAFQEAPQNQDEKQAPPAAAKLTPEQLTFFEAKIRPILIKSCYECHSADSKDLKADLLLDSRQGIQQGGSSGAVVVPGNPNQSLLIQAIRHSEPDLKMPPKNSGGKLPDSVIRDFEAWVKMGAPDPRDNGPGPAPRKYDTEEARKWWAYQPVEKPQTPKDDSGWSRGDIDRFVMAALKAKDLKPVADADKTTLIRRVYIDLIGLPPTPADIDEFVRDQSSDALAKVVDKLLARPQFGERWGRHWLDVARYAESSGKDSNIAFPHAWRYRDYVIAAFNSDKPFDQFIREQVAGDLLPAPTDAKRAEQQIATGFLAIGPKSLNEQANRQFALDVADEQVDATSQAFIGLTVSCARCHDHRFDPISQRDYYATAGIFLSTQTNYGTLAGVRNNHETDLIELPRSAGLPTLPKTQTPAERTRLKADLATVTKDYDEALAERREAVRQGGAAQDNAAQKQIRIQGLITRKSQIESQLESFDEAGKPKVFAMGVQDRPAGSPPSLQTRAGAQARGRRQPSGFERIADSPLFFRGEVTQPRDRVPRGVPEFLAWSGAAPISDKASGRKELADWLASRTNPLTARVLSNRLWHWLFGQGIVVSVDNFGTMGEAPSNQALLDHLATRLIENGWSVKKTIREIVLSRTYQLASTHDERSFGVDPQNALMWRHSKRRLDAECIRDAMLASSGQLTLEPLVGSAVAVAGDGPIVARRPGARGGADPFVDAQTTHRSVYLPVARDMLPDALDVFDAADPSMVTGARETTNVPSQALFLLNNDFVRAQAKLLAQNTIAAFPAPASTNNAPAAKLTERATMVFRLTLGRAPGAEEIKAASKFFQRRVGQSKVTALDAWTDFCLAIYNTAEFRYLN